VNSYQLSCDRKIIGTKIFDKEKKGAGVRPRLLNSFCRAGNFAKQVFHDLVYIVEGSCVEVGLG